MEKEVADQLNEKMKASALTGSGRRSKKGTTTTSTTASVGGEGDSVKHVPGSASKRKSAAPNPPASEPKKTRKSSLK